MFSWTFHSVTRPAPEIQELDLLLRKMFVISLRFDTLRRASITLSLRDPNASSHG
jgi:hypothetical protein